MGNKDARGNFISHVDPLITANGTCLRGAQPETIYVAHLDWWRYYRNAVVGKARNRYFIFAETSHSVSFFVPSAELDRASLKRQPGSPTAPQMTPDDGWRQVWGPLLLERCKQLITDRPKGPGVDEATNAGIQALCQEISKGEPNRR